MQKNISHTAMLEHLTEMMERLLDDDIVKTKEGAQIEIAKANAMNGLVSQAIEIERTEIAQKEMLIHAIDVAGSQGYRISDTKKLLGITDEKMV